MAQQEQGGRQQAGAQQERQPSQGWQAEGQEVTGPVDGVQGEGDYQASEAYNRETTEAARDRDAIAKGAREAADALDSAEGPALEAARRESAAKKPQ